MTIATCRTSGCHNEGIGIDVGSLEMIDDETGQPMLDGDGNPMTMQVACGACGQRITDLSEIPTPPKPDEPETEPPEETEPPPGEPETETESTEEGITA